MKFGKSLTNQVGETLPEWRDKFLSYKELKKRLKLIDPNSVERSCSDISSKRFKLEGGDFMKRISDEESDFIRLLEEEVEKFNNFFVEKEEEYIIRLKELQDGVMKASCCGEETMNIRKEIVDFHGEMVLLENYSALNYTGLVKIIKKYEKRTGSLIRLPFIEKVLQQPFFTTDLVYKLVKECEAMLDRLFSFFELPAISVTETGTSTSKDASFVHDSSGLAEVELAESIYMKRTIAALKALKEIRSGSSTVNVFSLPPLQVSMSELTLKKMPLLEQLAK